MRLALVLPLLATGCSFFCIPAGNCVTNQDCGEGYDCPIDAGVCTLSGQPVAGATGGPSSGASSGGASGGSSGGASGGSSRGSSGATSGSGSSSGASSTSGGQGNCHAANMGVPGSCCGSQWAYHDSACAGVSLTGSGYNSLYATSYDSNGETDTYAIYQIPAPGGGSMGVQVATLSTEAMTFTVVSGTGTQATFIATGSFYALGEASESGFSPFTSMESSIPVSGLGWLNVDGGTLAIATDSYPQGLPLPNGGGWLDNVWANNNSERDMLSLGLGQMVPVGPGGNALLAASMAGAVTLAYNGDICFSTLCVSDGAGGTDSQFPGVAVDPTSGTITWSATTA